MKILIPNATTSKNLGDQAMLEVLVAFIQKTYPDSELIIHSDDPNHAKTSYGSIRQSITHYVADPHMSLFIRAARILYAYLEIYCQYVGVRFTSSSSELSRILTDFIEADYIFFCGGGSLRSKKGFKDFLYLLIKLLPFVASKLSLASINIFPISFGPFGGTMSEKLAYLAICHSTRVYAREKISFDLVKKYNALLCRELEDLSFGYPSVTKKHRRAGIALTIRDWFLSKKDQGLFENSFVDALVEFAKNHPDLTYYPFTQVSERELADEDRVVVNRVIEKLRLHGLRVFDLTELTNVSEALDFYASRIMVVTMRLHAAIFSSLVKTPFVCLSYEHKSRGICEALKLGVCSIEVSQMTSNLLVSRLAYVYKNQTSISKKLEKNVIRLKNRLESTLSADFSGNYATNTKSAVHIVIPAYNETRSLPKLLHDLQGQTIFNRFTVVVHVINDGSGEEFKKMLQTLDYTFLRIVTYTKRKGKVARLNDFFSTMRKNDIVIQLDSDIRLQNENTLLLLLEPILSGTHMVCGSHRPQLGNSVIAKVSEAAYLVWHGALSYINNRAALYYCNGNIRAFSGTLVQSLRFPVGSGSCEDLYSYIFAKNHNYRVSYVQEATAYYQPPLTVRDYLRQMVRFQNTGALTTHFFPNCSVKRYFTLRFYPLFCSTVRQFCHHPMYVTFYIVLQVISRIMTVFHRTTDTWQMVETSKA